MRPNFLAGMPMSRANRTWDFKAADALGHQRGDVAVATVLAQQRGGMEKAGHHVVGDRERAQRGVHRPALERCAGRRLDQQVRGAGEGGRYRRDRRGSAATPSRSPPDERRSPIGCGGVHTLGMWRATSPGAKL